MNVKRNITVPTNFICRSRRHAKKGGSRKRGKEREERGGERGKTLLK